MFHTCTLTQQQAKGTFYALHLVEPDFEAEIPPARTQLNYPPLVKNLYNNRKKEHCHLMGVAAKFTQNFSDEEIAALFEKQMEREIAGVTKINSIEKEKLDKIDSKKSKTLLIDWRERWKNDLTESLAVELDEIRSKKRG